MAIRPFGDESPLIEPLCALKVGSFNCFCMWTPNGPPEAQTETQLRSLSPGQSGGHAPLPDSDVPKVHLEESTDAGSDATSGPSAVNGEASSMESCVAVDHPLLSTLRLNLGRRSPLLRELAKIGSASDARNIDTLIWEQVRRVTTHHEEALMPCELVSSDWSILEQNGELGLHFGCRSVEGTLHWFRGMDFPESDVVKAFAAFLEVDLCCAFLEELILGEPLGMHTAKRDSVWRTLIQGQGIKQDNICVHSWVDALDEPVRSLLVFSSTTQRPPGLLLVPPPHTGFTRSEFECTITRIQPLRHDNGQPTGFRLSQTGVSRPCGSRGSGSNMPLVAAQESFNEEKTKKFFGKLRECLDKTHRLDQRLNMSPRSPLYDRVRKHLANLPS